MFGEKKEEWETEGNFALERFDGANSGKETSAFKGNGPSNEPKKERQQSGTQSKSGKRKKQRGKDKADIESKKSRKIDGLFERLWEHLAFKLTVLALTGVGFAFVAVGDGRLSDHFKPGVSAKDPAAGLDAKSQRIIALCCTAIADGDPKAASDMIRARAEEIGVYKAADRFLVHISAHPAFADLSEVITDTREQLRKKFNIPALPLPSEGGTAVEYFIRARATGKLTEPDAPNEKNDGSFGSTGLSH